MRRVGWLLGLVLVLAACHRPAPEVGEGAWTVQWWTDFREPGPWQVNGGPGAIASYTPDGYRLAGVLPQTEIWSLHPTAYDQVRLAAQLQATPAPQAAGRYGLLCGFQGPQQYLVFALSTDGGYAILARTPQGWQNLRGTWQAFEPHAAVHPAPQSNRLMVECRDTGLRFWVNGQEVARVAYPATKGQVGLWMTTPAAFSTAAWSVTARDLTLWTWQRP